MIRLYKNTKYICFMILRLFLSQFSKEFPCHFFGIIVISKSQILISGLSISKRFLILVNHIIFVSLQQLLLFATLNLVTLKNATDLYFYCNNY